MFRILACLQNQHDVRLIAVAFTICVAASGAAVYLLRQSMRGVKDVRWPWVAVSGVAAGFGVWATHFVAMLAYMPGLRFGFDLPLTLASLVAVMLITTGAFAYVAHCRLNPRSASAGGALFGLGVGVMHYMGMKAVLMPARISWSMDLASASLLLGAGFGAASLHLLIHGKHRSLCTAAAAGLIALSVLSLHFTAMGAITLKLDPARALGPLSLLPVNLATVIAVVAIAILAVCVAVAAIDNRADQATRETERRFQILVQGVTDYAIFMLDPQGYVSNWNSGAEHLKGYSAAEIVGKHMSQFYLGKERAAGSPQGNLSQALREGKFEGEGWRVRKDGSRFWAHVLIDPIWSDDGQLIGFAKVTRDITQQKQDNDRIMDVTRNLNAALSHMSQGLTLYDANDRLVLYNKRLLELYDLTDEEVRPGSQYIDILRTLAAKSPSAAAQGPEFVQSIYANSMAAIRQPGGGVMMGRVRADRDLIISFRPLPDGGWVSTVDDITELRSHQAQIAHMATHDTLTGLPNRAHINERIDAALEPARRMSRQVAVIAIDLDRFKDINDIHGHRVGDAVLKVLADRMLAACRFGECVARVGGDEFAALKVFDDRAELDAFLALLRDGLSEPFSVDGVEMEPSGSLGVALYPADGASREILANNAGLALKRAKASLDNRVRFYEARMDDAARLRRDLAHELWTALERQEFQVFYQVQNDVQTGAISGFEALVRWPHPQRGWISPAEFIPLAEACGAILDLGAWVLRTACAEVASWAQPYKVAVNLSPLQLTQLDLAKFVHETLIETGLSARYLELEITESVIIGDKARALHVLRQIKAMGVTIAMDDFGTGYSSLDTLQSFPFDKIKIDRSFLVESETNPQSKAIIRAIIALGRSLGVPVLAEGVETHAQLAYLRAEGCDQVQGYLFGRPQPGHQLFAEAG